MDEQFTVTIIVPFFNQEHIVEKNIYNLLKLDYHKENLNFVFIDDGSKDNTAIFLKKFRGNPRIKVILSPNNRGRSFSRNMGIEATNSELIGFLDGDMRVNSDWLKCLISKLDNDTVGVMGDSCSPKNVEPNSLDRYFYSFYRGARHVGESKPLHFRWFLFNNTVIRRSALEVVGKFDDIFTTYGGEDTDLSIRLWEKYPYGLRFSSKAISEHYHERHLEEFCSSMYSYGKNNLPILLKRYPKYKNDLGGDYIQSIKGKMIFNFFSRYIVNILKSIFDNYWLKRYLVIDSVIRGARRA